jgi:hypothetical protein
MHASDQGRRAAPLIAALGTLALSLIASPAAQASVTYAPIASFNAEINGPLGVAVDQASGRVYVANLLSDDIGWYGPTGSHIETVGRSFGHFAGAAVDSVNGNVYVIDGEEIETYNPLHEPREPVSAFSIAGSTNLTFSFEGSNFSVSAVQIASDSAGNVYLPNAPNNEIQEFNPEGHVLHTITGSGAEALKEPTGVAVDAAGNVYVADNGNGRVEEFSPGGAFIVAIGTGVDQTTKGNVCTAASGDICGTGSDGSQALALDGAGDIFVGENNGSGFHVVLYSPAGAELTDFGMGTIGSSGLGAIDTLAVGPTGLVYVTDGANNVVWIYAKQSEPSLVSVSSSAVTQTSATLNATIGPGHADTSYHFEYGTSTAYGTSVPVPDADIGIGLNGPAVVGQELTGLALDTTYHYRVIASNALGQDIGNDRTFTTPPLQPPVVSTGQASGVAQNAATLTATIDTQGFQSTYEFDLGTDTSYGTRIFGDAGVQAGAHTFAAGLQGLAPGTTYHYRIVASNIFGTSYGTDQTLTTVPVPGSVITAPPPPPLIATQVVTFPTEVKTPTTTKTTKALTNAQKLKNALKVCGKKPKKQRAACEKQARKRYGAAQKTASRASKANHRNGVNRRGKR